MLLTREASSCLYIIPTGPSQASLGARLLRDGQTTILTVAEVPVVDRQPVSLISPVTHPQGPVGYSLELVSDFFDHISHCFPPAPSYKPSRSNSSMSSSSSEVTAAVASSVVVVSSSASVAPRSFLLNVEAT